LVIVGCVGVVHGQTLDNEKSADEISREIHRVSMKYDFVDAIEIPNRSGFPETGYATVIYYDEIGIAIVIDYQREFTSFKIYRRPGSRWQMSGPIAEIARQMISNGNCLGATSISKAHYEF
jgi:hypothetical protein